MDIVTTYGEAGDQVMQGLAAMLFGIEDPLKGFKKAVYTEKFQQYFREHGETIRNIEQVYQAAEDKEDWCQKLGECLAGAAKEKLDAIPRKGKRDNELLNYNMVLAVYLLPAILESRIECADLVTDTMISIWNKQFKTSVGKASYDKIQEGFRTKLCYITTAVCESQGKADDCYELNLLRSYRDEYLMATPEGRELVELYYDIAPTIVTRLNKEDNAADLYQDIWSTYLNPCIGYIEAEEMEACKARYMEMVLDLKGRYITS